MAKRTLQEADPKLAKEWHPKKNGSLILENVTLYSNKKVWWICDKDHEWLATVAHRSSGSGCPYCSGNTVCNDNCLATLNPNLAKQWHPTKNLSLTPMDVTIWSNKKIWWKCDKGYEWLSTVAKRSWGTGCPYCSGNTVCDDNCLSIMNPDLTKQWHPTKNLPLTPRNVQPVSHNKVWWMCTKGHEWETKVCSRSAGNGCPKCWSIKRKTAKVSL